MKSPSNRGGLRSYLVLIALVRGVATHWTIAAGVPLVVLGTALHFWAKGCLRQNLAVAKIGPYRFVQHPFYLGNGLIDAGIAVMSGWWVLELVLPVWWLAIYLPVMRREESHLTGVFGAVYREYRERVPCLVPWRRPLPRGSEGFRWDNPNIAAEGEVFRALRILMLPLLLVCTDLRAEGLSRLADGVRLAELVGLGVLYGLLWASKRLSSDACSRPHLTVDRALPRRSFPASSAE
jgi:hypothetical protein